MDIEMHKRLDSPGAYLCLDWLTIGRIAGCGASALSLQMKCHAMSGQHRRRSRTVAPCRVGGRNRFVMGFTVNSNLWHELCSVFIEGFVPSHAENRHEIRDPDAAQRFRRLPAGLRADPGRDAHITSDRIEHFSGPRSCCGGTELSRLSDRARQRNVRSVDSQRFQLVHRLSIRSDRRPKRERRLLY